jgi:hypothetical protein
MVLKIINNKLSYLVILSDRIYIHSLFGAPVSEAGMAESIYAVRTSGFYSNFVECII